MTLFETPALMWVTDERRSNASLPRIAHEAVAGGVDIVQVRESEIDSVELASIFAGIDRVVPASTRIVVNSDIALAKELHIGVHLPERGPSIADARDILGDALLVGRSVHSVEAARESAGADYLIVGHVYETGSKPGRKPLGIEQFSRITAVASAPVIAIGGVTVDRVPELIAAGAAGIAVQSPLTDVETARERSEGYRQALEQCVRDSNEMIAVTINGKAAQLLAGTTISALLAGRDLHERLVVVERNGEIVKRAFFSDVVLEEGDLLEIVHFVGGG